MAMGDIPVTVEPDLLGKSWSACPEYKGVLVAETLCTEILDHSAVYYSQMKESFLVKINRNTVKKFPW